VTTFRWYLVGLLTLFGAYVALEYYRPKPLDWSPSLSSKDKIPYGTFVLFDALPQVLGTDSVASVREPIYNQLLGAEEPQLEGGRPTNVTFDDDSTDAANDRAAAKLEAASLPLANTQAQYIFINQIFRASTLETDALLRFVAQGHNVFIAAESFERTGRGTTLAAHAGPQRGPGRLSGAALIARQQPAKFLV
jgi:hypothetical protein